MSSHSPLRAKIQDPSGRPIAGARVLIESGPGPFPDIAALSDDRGEVLMKTPSAGRYGLACAAEGFRMARVTVEIADEAPPTVIFELKPEG